ncbi:MAG: DUF4890 domain-containing protein [Flavobacteriaceae bacterium]|nr:DUF4890 domain-containing protein [Flavobacteriaceae bacterium]
MKYLFSFLFSVISLISFAQNKQNQMMKIMNDFTPEQRAVLQTKKMTLRFDLNATQQNQLLALNKKSALEKEKKMATRKSMKESGTKPTADQKFKSMNDMLDSQLAYQKEMKSILNKDQYEQWKKTRQTTMMKKHKRSMAPKRQGKKHQMKTSK